MPLLVLGLAGLIPAACVAAPFLPNAEACYDGHPEGGNVQLAVSPWLPDVPFVEGNGLTPRGSSLAAAGLLAVFPLACFALLVAFLAL